MPSFRGKDNEEDSAKETKKRLGRWEVKKE
jgi:hypothetical protein